MGHEQCGLMARLWRSCGSARKTSRIARSCRVCRRCNISRYRRTVCTAARSGVCDRRERSLRHLTAVRRATPKRKERSCASRPRYASAVCYRAGGGLGAVGRPPWRGRHGRRPSGHWLRPPACVCRRRSAGRIGRRAHGARAAPDRADQSLLLPFGLRPTPGGVLFEIATDAPRLHPSTSRKRPWATRSSCRLGASPAAPRSWRRWRRSAGHLRGNASRGDGAAKFLSARLARGLFLLCAHGHEAIMSAHGDAEDMKRS
jgi:hypothetical protein